MNYDQLLLRNQLCFPLYASSKKITNLYKPYLTALNLTYTQYITMMVLWEHKTMSLKELGTFLFLDSGTLTPVLKKLEQKGFITRVKDSLDERKITVQVTQKGYVLQEEAKDIPHKIAALFELNEEEAQFLYKILYKIIYN